MNEDSDPKGCPRCNETWDTLRNVRMLAEHIDHMLLEAVEAGLQDGRILGLVEAATCLERAGHKQIAKIIKDLVDDDIYFMKAKGDA